MMATADVLSVVDGGSPGYLGQMDSKEEEDYNRRAKQVESLSVQGLKP